MIFNAMKFTLTASRRSSLHASSVARRLLRRRVSGRCPDPPDTSAKASTTAVARPTVAPVLQRRSQHVELGDELGMRPQVACERLKHRVGQRSPAVDERLEQIDADADVSGVGNEVHLAISDAERLADEGVPHRDELFPNKDEWINAGDAVIYKPFGGAIAGPMHKKKGAPDRRDRCRGRARLAPEV